MTTAQKVLLHLLDLSLPGTSPEFLNDLRQQQVPDRWFRGLDHSLFLLAKEFYRQNGALVTDTVILDFLQRQGEREKAEVYQELFTQARQEYKDKELKKADFQYALRQLEDEYLTGELTIVGDKLIDHVEKGQGSQGVSDLRERLAKIQGGQRKSSRPVDLARDADLFWQDYQEREQFPEKFKGIPTGFSRFDQEQGGVYPGELLIIGGRQSVGKSLVMQQMAVSAFQAGYNGIYDSHEMNVLTESAHGLQVGPTLRRLYGMEARVNQTRLRQGKLESEERERLLETLERIKQRGNRLICLPPGYAKNCDQLDAEIQRLSGEMPIHFLISDYLQIMYPNTPCDSKVEAVGTISLELRELGVKWGIPVVSGSQLTRKSLEMKGGGMESLSWSDEIGSNSDVVWLLDQTTAEKTSGTMNFRVKKSRDGKQFDFAMYLDMGTLWYQEAALYLDGLQER